ncbi:transporter suffix domain-containing protein [Aurantimonas sp. A2-1-M11]|uniref:transporter suffix domain-containing protein n=1 Tax=Aurantimonas sp. A2-1-M11 TaxID=3113712 RepID=UPI002F92AA6D
MSSHASIGPETSGRPWRFKIGVALFGLMIVLILLIPVAAASGMAPARVATITGAIFVGNKIILLLTIAVMGKAGFQELKGMIGGYIPRLKSDGIVSPTRHVVGLVMFCLPIITAWLEPYLDAMAPGLRPNLWQLQLLGDLMLVASIFVLGGNFWEKVRALFIRTARVATPLPAAAG